MAPTKAIQFIPVGDLIGTRHGVLDDGPGGRRVLVSPAIYSLLQTDKPSVLMALKVKTGAGLVWVMDLN